MIYYHTIFDILILRDIITSIVIILLFYTTPLIVINKYLKSPLLSLALVLYLNILLNYIFLKNNIFYYIVCIGLTILFIKSGSINTLSKVFKFINRNKLLLVLFTLYILGHIRITNDGTIFLAGSGDLRHIIHGASLSVISQMEQVYPSLPHNLYVLILTTPFIVDISPFVFNIIFKIFLLGFFYIYISYNFNYNVRDIIVILSLSFGFVISIFFLVYIISTMIILQPKVFWNLPEYGLPSKFLVPVFMLNENGGEHAMLFILIFPFIRSNLDVLGTFLLITFFQTPFSLFLIPLIILINRFKLLKYKILMITALMILNTYIVLTEAVQATLYRIIIKNLSIITGNFIVTFLIYATLFSFLFIVIGYLLKSLSKQYKLYISLLYTTLVLLLILLINNLSKISLYYIILIILHLIVVFILLIYKQNILLKDTLLQYFVLLALASGILIAIIDDRNIGRLYIFLVLSIIYIFSKFLNLNKIHYGIKIFAIATYIIMYLAYSLLWIYVESGIGPLFHLSLTDLTFINKLSISSICAFNTSAYPPKTFYGASYYDVCTILMFDIKDYTLTPYKIISIGYLGHPPVRDVTYLVYNTKFLNISIHLLCVNNTNTWFTTITFHYYDKHYGDLTCTLYSPANAVLLVKEHIAVSPIKPAIQYIFVVKT